MSVRGVVRDRILRNVRKRCGPSTLNWTTSLKRSIVKIKKVGGLFMRRERREYSNEFKQQMV
ncbi:hypothetical protein, partial [Mammaliicoccus sciuri]|uniref:hypothetical protein n=1 Tax=Mammaliicoccus sciuri TaxID=1296 RepID=UPI001C7134CE